MNLSSRLTFLLKRRPHGHKFFKERGHEARRTPENPKMIKHSSRIVSKASGIALAAVVALAMNVQGSHVTAISADHQAQAAKPMKVAAVFGPLALHRNG